MREIAKRAINKARAGISPLRSRAPGVDPMLILDGEETSTDQGPDDDCAEEGYHALGVMRTDAVQIGPCPTDESGIDDDIAELIASETGEYPVRDDLMVSSAMMAAIDDPEDLEDIES
jgi:hypothetical protein